MGKNTELGSFPVHRRLNSNLVVKGKHNCLSEEALVDQLINIVVLTRFQLHGLSESGAHALN